MIYHDNIKNQNRNMILKAPQTILASTHPSPNNCKLLSLAKVSAKIQHGLPCIEHLQSCWSARLQPGCRVMKEIGMAGLETNMPVEPS